MIDDLKALTDALNWLRTAPMTNRIAIALLEKARLDIYEASALSSSDGK
jgi:hypothetical protein